MHIVLLCATNRGYLFLKKLYSLMPGVDITVFSFRETAWEPPYFNKISGIARERDSRIIETKEVGSIELKEFWDSLKVDLMFVVSWRYMIPKRIYEKPSLGTYVFHDSLLPEYRGFSPTVWAMINGEDHTGVTLFEIGEEVDCGDIVDQIKIPIGKDETIDAVMERVTQGYLNILKDNLKSLLSGSGARIQQDDSRATYTCKRLPEDNLINWTLPAANIYNLIRAVSRPYPGAYTYLNGSRITVWSASLLEEKCNYVGAIPGRISEIIPDKGAVVQTGKGSILLTEIQPEDGKPVFSPAILNRLDQTFGSC